MRTIFSIIMLCCMLTVQAKPMKVKQSCDVETFSFKIEKVDVTEWETVVYIKVKQKENFSYNISFKDCILYTEQKPEGVKGELTAWNGDKKITSAVKPISDLSYEKLELTFPPVSLKKGDSFKILIGKVQDRKKTDIVIENVNIPM